MPHSSVCGAGVGSNSRCFPLAWSMASRRVIARPRSHCASNVASPTCERRSSRFGVGSGHPSSNVTPDAHEFAEQCGAGVQSDGKCRVSLSGGEPRRHLECARERRVIADVAFDRERLGEQDARGLGVARLEREKREVGERVRDAPGVVQTSVDGQALVEQSPGRS